MGCHIDEFRGAKQVFDTCVFDYDQPADCTHAEDLMNAGTPGRHNCKYWRDAKAAVCKCCGQALLPNAK